MSSSWNYTTKPVYYLNGVKGQVTPVATSMGWTDTTKTPPEVIIPMRGLNTIAAAAASYPTFTITPPANATYTTGQTVGFTLVPNVPVDVTYPKDANVPYIVMTLTSGTVNLIYKPLLSTSTSLVFQYVVQAGDVDLNGVNIASAVSLPSGASIGHLLPYSAKRPVPLANLIFTPPTLTGVIVN